MDEDEADNPAVVVLAAAQSLADTHRQLTDAVAWRMTGGPNAGPDALARLREVEVEQLDLLTKAVRVLEDALGLEEERP